MLSYNKCFHNFRKSLIYKKKLFHLIKWIHFNIKKASIDDVEELLQLQKQHYLSEADRYKDYHIKPLIQTLDDINAIFQNRYF
jgi:hypothetical protein